MNILKKLGLQPRITVYCQNCGRDITNFGGDVSGTGRVYCHGYKDGLRCQNREIELILSGEQSEVVTTRYRRDIEVQRDIKDGELKEFGPIS